MFIKHAKISLLALKYSVQLRPNLHPDDGARSAVRVSRMFKSWRLTDMTSVEPLTAST